MGYIIKQNITNKALKISFPLVCQKNKITEKQNMA